MGCASSKPSSSNKKKHEKSPAGKSASDAGDHKKSSKSAKSTPQTNGHHQHTPETNGSVHDKSPLHLKQQAQAERARRLAQPLHVAAPVLQDIDQNRNQVITYLVTNVRRDLNNELISQHSGGNKMADLVMAAASANDNDDLIIDVVSRAVLLILNRSAGNTYKDLSDQLKSHQYLCKNQQHKQRICEITVDKIYVALENTDGPSSLADLLNSSSVQQSVQLNTPRTPSGDDRGFDDAVLMSRSQAKEVARILFLTDRARPVVHASPNSAHKDAYYVNKQLSDMSEVTVSKNEIEEILHAFEQPEYVEMAALRAKNLIDEFNSISDGSKTVTLARVDEPEPEVTIQFESVSNQPEIVIETPEENESVTQALTQLAAISALANQVEQSLIDSNNNLEPVDVKNSAENISSNSSSSAQVEQINQENGDLDPILKQSLLDDRFYNNDSFKTEPPVNGDQTNEAATVIQAGFKGHLERKETEKIVVIDQQPSAEPELEKVLEENQASPQPEPDNIVEPRADLGDDAVSVEKPVVVESPQETESASNVIDEPTPASPQPVEQADNRPVESVDESADRKIEEAATVIQATFRGYKARKELRSSSKGEAESPVGDHEPTLPEPDVTLEAKPNDLDLAATKIQATYRGFKTRKELKKGRAESEQPSEINTTE